MLADRRVKVLESLLLTSALKIHSVLGFGVKLPSAILAGAKKLSELSPDRTEERCIVGMLAAVDPHERRCEF